MVFVPVASQTHIVLDDDGVPIDCVEEGEPYRNAEGIKSYNIDARWLTVLTPMKRLTGKKAKTVLAQYGPAVLADQATHRLFGQQ